MIIERLVYSLVCLILLAYVVKKYQKAKSGIYLSLIAIQVVCIVTQLIAFFSNIYVDGFMQLYILIFNVILPACIFAADYMHINFEEFIEIKLGDFYAKRGKYDKAIEKYKKAITKNSNNSQTFAKLGRLYNAKGDRRTAFDRFARAIELDRNDYKSYYEIGVIFNDMGKQADAQIVLDNSLRIKPDFTPASELLAVVLCAQNKYDEAINVYRNATRYDSDNYQLYYRMGVVRTELRDFNDAKECYEKAIELNPNLYQAYFSLGQINLLKGELEQAKKMFEKSLASQELTAKSYYQLAKVYILNDEEIKAVTYLGYAIDIDSSYKYKAESEPLFAKIKDYITGISMANAVRQHAETTDKNTKKIEENRNNEEIKQKMQLESHHEEEINEEKDVQTNFEKAKESGIFKMVKNVLGFEDVEEDTESLENIVETEEDSNIQAQTETNTQLDENRDNNVKIEKVVTELEDKKDLTENESKDKEVDIYEKFKKLKKEEEEKAERLRREQKIRQLEELRAQDKNIPIESNEYLEENISATVRVVGASGGDNFKNEIKKINSNSEENENFENEDTMNEPHFDFMDRFKRR